MSKLNQFLLFYMIKKLAIINEIISYVVVIKEATDQNMREIKLTNKTIENLKKIQNKL